MGTPMFDAVWDAATRQAEDNRRKGSADSSRKEADFKRNGKRGRPRVEVQDENAAERRRTQIRLAQRAYRERKENSIASLEKQVSRLQATMKEMAQEFAKLHSTAVYSGIDQSNPTVALELQKASERILSITSQVECDVNTDEPAPKRRKRRVPSDSFTPSNSFSSPSRKTSTVPSSVESILGERELEHKVRGSKEISTSTPQTQNTRSRASSEETIHPVDMLGYEMIYEDDSTGPAQQMQTQEDFVMSDSPQAQEALIQRTPSYTENWLSLDAGLAPPLSYNFPESSFARRLLRYCYESTYQLLTNPRSNPAVIHRLLRFSLCFGSVKQITARIKAKLKLESEDTLEHWGYPSLHIGRSGLHYSREGIDNTRLPPNYLAETNFGPFPRNPAAERFAPDENFPFDVAAWAGIEGENWFDPYDVELYLREKGLFLDGSGATAEIEIDDSVPLPSAVPFDSPSSTSVRTYSGPISPASSTDPMNAFYSLGDQQHRSKGQAFDFTLSSTGSDADKATLSGASTAMNLSGDMTSFGVPLPKRKVTIDVDQLMRTINEYAVCLGRSPAFTQDNVDLALRRVMQEGW